MKPVYLIAALLIGAGSSFSVSPAFAAPETLFERFGERLKTIDLRGGEKDGATGYGRIVPTAPVTIVPDQKQAQPISELPQLAQSSDAAFRVNQLEEQVRLLNGKVEDMTFQLLELQEQIRKMQEDNEFRFQELEDQSSLGGKRNTGGESLGKPQPSEAQGSDGNDDVDFGVDSIKKLLNDQSSQLGAPPTSLGTLTFDANGNLVDSNVGRPVDLTSPSTSRNEAAFPDNPDELYNLGYQYVQAGRYEQSSEVFERFIAGFPENKRVPEAKFWLGESLFARGNYQESARVFLDNHKAHPQSALAPQNLLKLGVSLAGLEQRELACATYAEVPKKYPNISNAVRKRVSAEQAAAKCTNG